MGFLIIGCSKQASLYIPCLNPTNAAQKQFLPVAARGQGSAARAEPASRRPCSQVLGLKRVLQTGYPDRFFFVIFCSCSSRFCPHGLAHPQVAEGGDGPRYGVLYISECSEE